jgi:AraC-like DNA-binding protein
MANWTFNLDDLPTDRRRTAWIDILGRLRLPIADPASVQTATGSVTIATAPLGTEFALMRAAPQTFSGTSAGVEAGAWLVAILEGRGTLATEAKCVPVGPGTLIVGATGIDTTLTLDDAFSLLFVRFPKVAFHPRVIAPLEQSVRTLETQSGFGYLLFGFLSVVSRQLRHLDAEHLQATEQSTIDLLVGMLAASAGVAGKGGAAGARAKHLYRLCQQIEARLPDPELSLKRIAAEEGISPRYLQKLFTSSGQTFSAYVRERRLERCYADLLSPIHAQLSISEICYRWGFNDAPHFSRTFRARYGKSASAHRGSAKTNG